MPESGGIFTIPEYHTCIEAYAQARERERVLSYKKPDEVEEKDALKAKMRTLVATYFARLPVYLLARCPICGGEVHEAIDTFSLNGIGWRNLRPDGFGWRSGRSYTSNCPHVQLVGYGVNLNGIVPEHITQWVGVGSERPFVMVPFISLEDTYVVMHTLPVSPDGWRTDAHFTIYFTTYFTDNKEAFVKQVQPYYDVYSWHTPLWGDYELRPWVEKGKLYWLDPSDPSLPLRNQPVEAFPYGDMEGVTGSWYIAGGCLNMQVGRRGQHPRGHPPVEPKGCFPFRRRN